MCETCERKTQEGGDICIHKVDSLCYTVETKKQLNSNGKKNVGSTLTVPISFSPIPLVSSWTLTSIPESAFYKTTSVLFSFQFYLAHILFLAHILMTTYSDGQTSPLVSFHGSSLFPLSACLPPFCPHLCMTLQWCPWPDFVFILLFILLFLVFPLYLLLWNSKT